MAAAPGAARATAARGKLFRFTAYRRFFLPVRQDNPLPEDAILTGNIHAAFRGQDYFRRDPCPGLVGNSEAGDPTGAALTQFMAEPGKP
jgi:hypothetical protein